MTRESVRLINEQLMKVEKDLDAARNGRNYHVEQAEQFTTQIGILITVRDELREDLHALTGGESE